MITTKIEFKVFRVSDNSNDFGLSGMWLMDRMGRCWEVAANYLNKKENGTILSVDCDEDDEPNWSSKGFEIPERKSPDAPPVVVKQIWGD